MKAPIIDIILKATGARQVVNTTQIQELWSGYGQILRCRLEDGPVKSVVVKLVQLPEAANHPRGWNTDISHQRKLKSYQVEMNWYAGLAALCDESCRVPKLFYSESQDHEMLMIMEDLNSVGFPKLKSTANLQEIKVCLKWLANFHAKYMEVKSDELWAVGTYWHLATRPDELHAMQDPALKAVASQIDDKLNQAQYQTLVHGDAKLANFCFSEYGSDVAAVDFQYIGHGCGIKDVVYFLSSCMNEEYLSICESELLDFYFKALEQGLLQRSFATDFEPIRQEWRGLYAYAWADFYRFLEGWSPGHWKMHTYSTRIKEQVLREIDGK